METHPAGAAVTLVIELRRSWAGAWRLRVDWGDGPRSYQLRPARFVVRLRYAPDGRLLRGRLQRAGAGRWAPFQTSDELRRILADWLASSRV